MGNPKKHVSALQSSLARGFTNPPRRLVCAPFPGALFPHPPGTGASYTDASNSTTVCLSRHKDGEYIT